MFVAMQVKAIHSKFLQDLSQVYDSHEAAVIADMVFEEIAKTSKSILITQPQLLLEPSKVNKLETALVKLKRHEPVQYVLGKAWFYKLTFEVNTSVLIPRPETEELVAAGLYFIQGEKKETVLDIGTGSGCIAISIKKNAPNTSVTAIDISSAALQVAQGNAVSHCVDINWHESNFLDETSWSRLTAYDVIVSNPPYIPLNEKEKLDRNVTEYEPGTALFVPDNDPLIFYKKIAAFARVGLATSGKIFMEVHEDYAAQVAEVFRAENFYAEVLMDFYGKERMVTATHCR